jgi:GDP-L-fucose synthase
MRADPTWLRRYAENVRDDVSRSTAVEQRELWSHVVPALIRKFHEAKVARSGVVEIWGTGSPMREFLHVDDLADACLYLMDHYSDDQQVNVGTGIDQSIRATAEMVRT